MTKSKKQVVDMLEAHKDLFDAFKEIHDKYLIDPDKWQAKLNEEGMKIMPIVRRWENNLCSKSESTRYSRFSDNLADKFWEELAKVFPKISHVGMIKK